MDEIGVDHGELAGQVGFDEQVLVGGLDGLAHPADVGDGGGGGDGHGVGVTHAHGLHPLAQAVPVQGLAVVHLQVAAALFGQLFEGIQRQDALAPQ